MSGYEWVLEFKEYWLTYVMMKELSLLIDKLYILETIFDTQIS